MIDEYIFIDYFENLRNWIIDESIWAEITFFLKIEFRL